jgi:hypothetical protein
LHHQCSGQSALSESRATQIRPDARITASVSALVR